MLQIKSPSGIPILSLEINQGSKRIFTLMKEDYILLKFSLAVPMHFIVGSYADTDFGRFELTEPYQPKQNASTGGWVYELQLDAHYIKWKNKIFKYVPESANCEASWSLTAPLDVHMAIFLRNLAALKYKFNDTEYSFDIDTSVSNTAKLITYDNSNMLDALYSIADTFECEVWVEDSVIHFGRCEAGDAVEFSQDANVETMTPESNRNTYATRIYAFGSDRNIPKGYRPTSQDLTINGVVQKRLMLPSDTPYIDSEARLRTVSAIEQVVVFDDVYPRTRSAIADISEVEYDVKDDDGYPTGEKWKAYRFTTPEFAFSKEYILEGTDLQVEFQTGLLAGLTFCVKFNPEGLSETNPSAQLWEVIQNEDYGRPLPDTTLHPANGDEVIIIGWDSSKISGSTLISSAEQELKRRALEKIEELKIDPANYRCKMISAAMFDDGGVWHPYTLGSRVTLVNAGCFESGSRDSRIIGYEYDLARPFSSPIYIVGEKAAQSRTSELEGKVEALTLAGQTYTGTAGSGVYIIRTNDSTSPSDANVYSALRTKRDFLSRAHADSALGKITFIDGLTSRQNAVFERYAQFGDVFVPGIAGGQGGRIDRNANAELESLTLRSWLEVPELRYNRAEVLLGDQWQAPGAGIIESVVPDIVDGVAQPTGTITLKLEEGEIGAVAVDDICKGYFHDFGNTANNADADADDSLGNTAFAGFCTVYFRVTELLNDDGSAITQGQAYEGSNRMFRYALRPESERWHSMVHPYEAMHFVAYGNFTRADRQKSAYQTRTYTRYLTGVNDWEFRQANIAMQFGDLSNLSVYDLDMAGYSAYLQNIYFSGHLEHVDIAAPEVVTVTTSTGDFFIADGETLTVTCRVTRGFDDLTDYVQAWTLTRDSADAAADAAWNEAHRMLSPVIALTPDDIGATTLNASSLFTVTATGDGWSASVTFAARTLRLPTTLSMRFVSEYGEYDTFISYGDTVQFRAVIEDALRNDYTSQYDQWAIERHNGDTPDDIASDGVWNVTRAAISSAGVFSIEWSAQHDDLQAERATFVVTAQKGSAYSSRITGTLTI